MKAVQCHKFAAFSNSGGKPQLLKKFDPLRSVLSMDTIPKPKLIDNHVLIETHYAGIQYPDALQAQGLYQGMYVLCVCVCVRVCVLLIHSWRACIFRIPYTIVESTGVLIAPSSSWICCFY